MSSLMSRLQRWLVELRGVTVAPASSAAPRLDDLDFGVTVSNNSALKLTALYAGIRIRSENVASFPKVVKRQTEAGMVDDKSHPAYYVINIQPNSYTNKFDFWNVICAWLDGWGNSYAIIERNKDGDPIALHQIHPSCLIGLTVEGGHKWYKFAVPDKDFAWLSGTYKDDDVLHFMLVTFDGLRGVNPIIYNAIALGKSLATEKFASEYFRKGGNVKAVMETEGHMSDDEYKAFLRHMADAAGNFDAPLLEYGIKYKQLAINPVAAQLIQSETMSIQDVCRIINIPPHMIAELSHATFSNIEHQTIQFVQYSLRPTVKRLETELESKLFTRKEQRDYSVKFVLDGLLRGDTDARSKFYHNAILDGYMSRNEVRELEGMRREKGLDVYLYPLNTGEVGKPAPEK